MALGMRRSLELVTGIYAVLRTGAAFVPLDPDQPPERNDYILETTAPVCVLSTSRDGFDTSRNRVLNVDASDLSAYSSEPVGESEVVTSARPENLAYVIFTSGSTGRPKGVSVSHRAIVNQLSWLAAEYEFDDSDVVVQKTPVTFDVSMWELLVPLAVGARMIVARPDGHRDPDYLLSLMHDSGVTVAAFVPSMLAALLADPEASSTGFVAVCVCRWGRIAGGVVCAMCVAVEGSSRQQVRSHGMCGHCDVPPMRRTRAGVGTDW